MQSKEERCEMKGIRAATLRWSKKKNANQHDYCLEDLSRADKTQAKAKKTQIGAQGVVQAKKNEMQVKKSESPARKKKSLVAMVWRCRKDLRVYSGQGTTEYAILVGVLVVIAILAITVFRPRLQELWDSIASGINSL